MLGENPYNTAIYVLSKYGYLSLKEMKYTGRVGKCPTNGNGKGEFDFEDRSAETWNYPETFKEELEMGGIEKYKNLILNKTFKAKISEKLDIIEFSKGMISAYWLKKNLKEKNAILIGVNIGKMYKLLVSGRYYSKQNCLRKNTNHAVSLIGYKNDKRAWIIRDSWTKKLKGSNSSLEDITIDWRLNFYRDPSGMCVCGGEGKECRGMVIKKK